MVRIFVDSGSSIKQDEKESLGVEILPLRILIDNKEYLDGIDLDFENFYDLLINKNQFPKTSLPPLDEAEQKVKEYTSNGDEVIIITISSGISGTHDVIKSLFASNDKVHVVDSKGAVGSIRILAIEAQKYKDKSAKFIVDKLNALIPRIKIIAVPETLEYLHKGGRLSKASYMIGSILKIKPLIGFKEGKVHVEEKAIGLVKAKQRLLSSLDRFNCDVNYPIVPSYTYSTENLDELVNKADQKYRAVMTSYDNLDPAIACHWGPNAFGFIFVMK